jgi:hypothetical protein
LIKNFTCYKKEEEMNHLSKAVADQLGVTPEELEKGYKSGKYDSMLKNLPLGMKMQFMTAMNNPEKLNKLMSSPQAQALLKKYEE